MTSAQPQGTAPYALRMVQLKVSCMIMPHFEVTLYTHACNLFCSNFASLPHWPTTLTQPPCDDNSLGNSTNRVVQATLC